MDSQRLSDAELSLLFAEDAGADDFELEDPTAFPPDVFSLVVAFAKETLLESFLDLDDFLEAPLEVEDPVSSLVHGSDLGRMSQSGARGSFVLADARRPDWGRIHWVLPETALRRVLAHLLGAQEEELEGEFGQVHRASLESLESEFREALSRNFAERDWQVRDFEALEWLRDPSVEAERYLRVEACFQLQDIPLVVYFYLTRELASEIAERERGAAPSHPAPGPDGSPFPEEERSTDRGLTRGQEIPLEAFLGRARLPKNPLAEGQVIRLDRLAGDLVDLRIGGKKVADAEVVVVDGYYALKIRRLRRTPSEEA